MNVYTVIDAASMNILVDPNALKILSQQNNNENIIKMIQHSEPEHFTYCGSKDIWGGDADILPLYDKLDVDKIELIALYTLNKNIYSVKSLIEYIENF